MPGFLSDLIDQFQDVLERHRNRPFLEATMAACALVAAADGVVSFAERVRVDQIIQTLEALRIYDPHDGIDLFNEYTDAILVHPHAGHDKVMAALDVVKGEREKAELLIRICLAVSESNGKKHLADQVEIVRLCSHLGVSPRNLGLYVDSLPGA